MQQGLDRHASDQSAANYLSFLASGACRVDRVSADTTHLRRSLNAARGYIPDLAVSVSGEKFPGGASADEMTDDDALIGQIREQGANAYRRGASVFDNPFYDRDAMPAATGEPVRMWEAKAGAWSHGWHQEEDAGDVRSV